MSKPTSKRFEMVAPQEWIDRVDEWRRQQPDIPARAEAIRRLVGIGIAAQPIINDLLAYLETHGDQTDPDVKRSLDALRAAKG